MKVKASVEKYINIFFIIKGVAHLARYEKLINSYLAERCYFPCSET